MAELVNDVDDLNNIMKQYASTGVVPEITSVDEAGEPISDEPPAEETPPAEAEPPKEEAKPEQPSAPTADDLEDLRLVLEQEKIERQRLAAKLARQELVASREAGRSGYLEQELRKLQDGRAPRGEVQEEPEVADERPRRQPRSPEIDDLRRDLDDLRSAEISRAQIDTIQNFSRGIADWEAIKADLTEAVKRHQAEYGEDLASGSVKLVRSATKAVLNEAYADVRAAQVERQIAERRERRANQTKAMDQAKTQAAISGSGSAPAPKEVQKPLKEQDFAEVDKAFKSMLREIGR